MDIYTPADYLVLMRSARPMQPYVVHDIDFSFFKNYDALSSNFASIRPGKKSGDPVVTDIRAFHYCSGGDVLYKLRHRLSDPWILLPCRRRDIMCIPQALYKAALSITNDKFKNLQDLKAVMPQRYHSFYDSLKHDK